MREAPSRSGSSTTDSAASETAPRLAQPVAAEPDTSAPAVLAAPADPSEAERARGTDLYKQGDWQVDTCLLPHAPRIMQERLSQPQEGDCTAGMADFLRLFSTWNDSCPQLTLHAAEISSCIDKLLSKDRMCTARSSLCLLWSRFVTVVSERLLAACKAGRALASEVNNRLDSLPTLMLRQCIGHQFLLLLCHCVCDIWSAARPCRVLWLPTRRRLTWRLTWRPTQPTAPLQRSCCASLRRLQSMQPGRPRCSQPLCARTSAPARPASAWGALTRQAASLGSLKNGRAAMRCCVIKR